MAESLKDRYLAKDFFQQFSDDLKTAYPSLNRKKFYQQCVNPLDELELMQRITHLTNTVASHLPDNYKQSISILYDLSAIIDDKFGYLFMSEFVSTFGLNDYKISIKALRDFTHHSSSEFAIRKFLDLDFDRTIAHMLEWSEHDHEHIRRLASEGCRPRLPWSNKLQQVIDKPALTWKILHKLRNDNSKYVQKSVANHINDISKDNPDWLIKKISGWNQNKPATAWIIKHGCRTLIKQGHKPTLELFGVSPAKAKVSGFKLKQNKISLGEQLEFSFSVENQSKNNQKLVIDYIIHFVKKNTKLQPKTFKLKTINQSIAEKTKIKKMHQFKPMTTRKLYSGKHYLEIMINGESFAKKSFTLDATS